MRKIASQRKTLQIYKINFIYLGGGLKEIVLEKGPSLWQHTYFNSNHPIKNKNKIL